MLARQTNFCALVWITKRSVVLLKWNLDEGLSEGSLRTKKAIKSSKVRKVPKIPFYFPNYTTHRIQTVKKLTSNLHWQLHLKCDVIKANHDNLLNRCKHFSKNNFWKILLKMLAFLTNRLSPKTSRSIGGFWLVEKVEQAHMAGLEKPQKCQSKSIRRDFNWLA